MKTPKGLLFDCGDTVMRLEELDLARGAARLFDLARNPRRASLDQFLRLLTRLKDDWIARSEVSLLEISFVALWRQASARLGLMLEWTEQEIEQAFWDAAARVSLEPGIERALDVAERLELPAAILSNSIFTEITLRHALARLGVQSRFAFVMTSCEYGVRKPHPDLFATAAARLRLAPSEIWFVGDSLVNDVSGAIGAGMSGIWYNPHEQPLDESVVPSAVCAGWNSLTRLLSAGRVEIS